MLRDAQNQMMFAGATKMVAITTQDPDPEVFSAVVAFATSLFWGGNAVVQNSLLKHLETDRSQAFMRTFADKVRTSLAALRDWKSELAFVTAAVPELSGQVWSASVRGGPLGTRVFFFVKDRPQGPPWPRAVLKGPDFFFLLRTAPRDHQPPTANRHQPPTATNRQPPTATNRQPPTAANRQRRPTANCQPPPTTNHQPPTATNRQLPTANRQPPPTANRQPPPTANRQPPPTMVEHMECPRAFLGKLVPEQHFFSFPLRTALPWPPCRP